MHEFSTGPLTGNFLKSLGFPELRLHSSYDHFDFTISSRRILVIGPMGSGKTEFSARVWRDARVLKKKSDTVCSLTATDGADRRNVFFVRSLLDKERFSEYPSDALAYRGGYERCGNHIAAIRNSFDLEKLIQDHPEVGTWIIDEASFYDERLVYVIRRASRERGLLFIYPTLILNFRKDIFNSTARFLMETSTDVFPLTAYCEHEDCVIDSFFTYRYYTVKGMECPALYFDPLIIIGGDQEKKDPREPDYCTRCDKHHYLPGKEYTYFTLKPLGERAGMDGGADLKVELDALQNNIHSSELARSLEDLHMNQRSPEPVNMNSLNVPCIAEKALLYLYVEENLINEELFLSLTRDLNLDREYLSQRLKDNGRPLLVKELED